MADNNTNMVINTNTVRMTEKQKVKEITDRLEEGLKELFESEKYKTYLTTMSKFHNYSFNNTLLIAMQKPEVTLVAVQGVAEKFWQTCQQRRKSNPYSCSCSLYDKRRTGQVRPCDRGNDL